MALKAYKHLTDGEVKIVEEDSAEEAGLLADVVHGASYIQLQTDGTREEVAAAQGTALWTDVTADLGGGGSAFEHLTEDTDNTRLVADWPLWFSDGVVEPYAFIAFDDDDVGGTWTRNLTFADDLAGYVAGDYTVIDSTSIFLGRVTGTRVDIGNGSVSVSDGTDTAALSVDRLDLTKAGAGLRVRSPDGLTTKTITIDNSGTLTLV